MDKREVGARLKRLRAAKGLSQTEMATRLGFAGATAASIISKIESGDRRLGALELKIWADVCGVSADDILSPAPLAVEIGGAA